MDVRTVGNRDSVSPAATERDRRNTGVQSDGRGEPMPQRLTKAFLTFANLAVLAYTVGAPQKW